MYEHTCVCVCGVQVETNGHHGLSCIRTAGRQMRHTCVNDIIQRSLNSSGVLAIREPSGLEGRPNLRPDGVTLLSWFRGKTLMWDYTCPNTFAPSHFHLARQPQAAAEAKEISWQNMHILHSSTR